MPRGLFADLKVHHVGLSVRDLDEAIGFWGEIFGFELDFKVDIPAIRAKIAFVKRDGFRIELFEIENSAGVPAERLKPNTDLQTQGTKHICFSVEDVQGALEKLHERDVEIVGILRGKGMPMVVEADPRLGAEPGRKPAMAFFFLDASGTLVEIVRESDFNN
jgi:methylmalonyl-CoA/ethylmalonyl-CoA epimerase